MSSVNSEFISGHDLSRQWKLEAFELHQILQDEGLNLFDRHFRSISIADALPQPDRPFDNLSERCRFEHLYFKKGDMAVFEKKWGAAKNRKPIGGRYAGNLYYPLQFVSGRRLIKFLEIDDDSFLELVAANTLSVYDSLFTRIDNPIETLESNRYTRNVFDLNLNESFLLLKLKELFFDSTEVARFYEEQARPHLSQDISCCPDFTSAGIEDLVNHLKWMAWQSMHALHDLYQDKHALEGRSGELENPAGITSYIEQLVNALETYRAEIQRLSYELPLFTSTQHIDSFKQLHQGCLEMQRSACEPFRKEFVDEPVDSETLQSLIERMHRQTLDILGAYQVCGPIAHRIDELMAWHRHADRHSEETKGGSASKSLSIRSRNFDVVIIGAGPAGLECARVLAGSHLSVLILEKNKQIGPKTCAGGIVGTVEPLDLPEKKARTFNAVTVFLRDKPYEFTTRLSLKIIDRQDLGCHQAELLKGAGNVVIKTGTVVRKVDTNRVVTTAGDFNCRFLVGADGSTSMVRRYLKLDSRYMVGIYYDMDEPKDRMIFRLDGRVFKTGYIWEFPHQQFTNVGFYYNPIHWKSKRAVRILRNYMEGRGYPMDSRTFRAFPINCLHTGCQFSDNIFLTGDAAGLASRLTGEGIAYAMISGREVARKILDPQYNMPKLNEIVANKNRQDNLVGVLEKLPVGLDMVYLLHLKALKTRILRWPA